MNNKVLSKIFIDVGKDLGFNVNYLIDNVELEKVLEDYLVSILGNSIKNSYDEHFREIRKYFENIFVNKDSNIVLIDFIKIYADRFNNLIDEHPLVKLFIDSMKRMYSLDYDGRVKYYDDYNYNNDLDMIISNKDKSFVIGRMPRRDVNSLPFICIKDIDEFELVLEEYVETVKNSNTFYNIIDNDRLSDLPLDARIKALFECTIFNASSNDLIDVSSFISKFSKFVVNDSLSDLCSLKYIGKMCDDELYVMLKRSELEYETPYCLCFMLKNNVVELPYVRLGIEELNGKKIAHILSVQSSQSAYINRDNLSEVDKYLKKIIPKGNEFRNFNPSHLVSILMSFGILKGLGIEDVVVADYLPFRFNKTIIDKQMNEEESDNFQRRLTDKNLYTYMRLCSVTEGIEIINYPDEGRNLELDISKEIRSRSDELNNIYNMCYKLGMDVKSKEQTVKNNF